MLKISDAQGAIFDVDDTLLDNGSYPDASKGIHAISRIKAIHEVGRLHNNTALLSVTSEENIRGFHTAKVHSLPGAVWNILYMKGLVDSPDIDPENQLLQEIVELKNQGHEAVLRAHGKEVRDAGAFVRNLAAHGFADKLAIASASIRRDIDIFLDMAQLTEYFPANRIVSLEMVKHAKPNKDAFDQAFKLLGLPDSARRSVYAFEDDPRGVLSAKAAGLYVIAITTRFRSDDAELLAAQPDLIVDSYAECNELLGLSAFKDI